MTFWPTASLPLWRRAERGASSWAFTAYQPSVSSTVAALLVSTLLVLLPEVSERFVLGGIISETQRTSAFAAVSSLSIIFFIADLLLLSISRITVQHM